MLKHLVAVAACSALLGAAPALARQTPPPAQPSPHEQHQMQTPDKPGMQGQMPDCQGMMAQHQKMMEELQGMDAKLESLVQTMNGANGQAKVDATAAVVTELVAQRKMMRERMEGMQMGMMHHMMEHMQAGGAQGMMNCPMMKQTPK